MKTLLIFICLTIMPITILAQDANKQRASVNDNEVRKGFYGNLNINSLSPFDQTYNLGLGAGMHFSENFHIGLIYFQGNGDTQRFSSDTLDVTTGLNYSSFGIELGYEIPVAKHFSILPFFNQSFVNYTYSKDEKINIASSSDQFLNTQIGAKLMYVANENLKFGLNLSYGLANGVTLFQTTENTLSGLNAGITIQYNHFLPKW